MPPITFIGFGEAGMAFAEGIAGPVVAYDCKTGVAATRNGKLHDYAATSMAWAETNRAAVAEAKLIVSLVTADQALAAARETARSITRGALYCDMNSVAPETKDAAAQAIGEAGGRYVDVAVMAPVQPLRRAVPLLVSGPHEAAAVEALRAAGFSSVSGLSGPVGAASSVKMIRSVMVKGMEALTAECMLAAHRAGVLEDVVASLDASASTAAWAAKADYNLDRMIVHGRRRAEEMEEVIKTLDALGVSAAMTRATVKHQRAIGQMDLAPTGGLADKLDLILHHRRSDVA